MCSKKFILLLLAGLIMMPLVSCSSDDDEPTPDTEQPDENKDGEEAETPEEIDPDDGDLNPNSQNVSYENAVSIDFSGMTATVTNPFDGNGVTVSTDGAHISITSTRTDIELNYVLSGITTDGSLKIYGEYKFGIVLNGVGITNPNGAAINNQCGKKTTVTVEDNTNNRLIDGSEYTYVDGEDMKGTFFSEGQLNFYGNGNLEVRGKNKHAICTDDYFRMYEGNITIKEAASDAIHAKDYAQIDGGTIKAISVGEGIDVDGHFIMNGGKLQFTTTGQKGHGIKTGTYATVNDGNITILVSGIASKCFNVTEDLNIYDGTFNLTTQGDAYFDTDDQDTSSAAAIKCDGNALIDQGKITIYSSGSGGKGINVSGTLTFNDATVNVSTTGDQYVYNSQHDTAAKAIKSDGNLTVNGGTIVINTSKTEAEGLESKASLYINGGTVEITAYDDAINASDHIEITGGNTYAYSTVNDAIDSNGTLTISGGVVIAAGSTSPEGGIDCDQSRFAMTGGTVIGIGGSTSTPTTSASTQCSVIYSTSGSSVQIVRIESSTGSEVLTFKLPRTYSQLVMLFSSPSLAANTSYSIYTGGSISGGTNFHGLYSGATYSGGASASTFTTSSMVTTVGSTGGNTPGGNNNRP